MNTQPIGTNTLSPLFSTRVRFNVGEKVETQVVDISNDRIVRQMPIENTSRLLEKVYA